MKKKIIGFALKDIKKGEEIEIYLDEKWKSEQVRFYKQGQKFLFKFVKRYFKKFICKKNKAI